LADNEKLQVAWRYNNLLDSSKNAGEIENKTDNKAMGRGLSIQYKFDNSKPMAATVQNSPSHKLNKEDNLTLIQFDNECYGKDASKHPLHCLWETICEGMQQKLENEEDDRIFRLVLPDFNLFIPQLMDQSMALHQFHCTALIRFIKNLKSLVRASNCTCLVSVDPNLLPLTQGQPRVQANLENLADLVLQLTSFKEQAELKIGDYDGTIKLVKQVRLHGLLSGLAPFDIYALKLLKGKTGIVVETIHLEPESDRAD